MILDVPFVTQVGNKYRNDCGAACFSMVSGVPIDTALEKIGKTKNEYLNGQDLWRLGSIYGVELAFVRPLSMSAIRSALFDASPLIVLVGYASLPEKLKAVTFNGNHWVVVVGADENGFFINDPLWGIDDESTSRVVYWPTEVLSRAMTKVDAYPMQGFIVQKRFPPVRGIERKSQIDVSEIVASLIQAKVEIEKMKNKLDDLSNEIARIMLQIEQKRTNKNAQ